MCQLIVGQTQGHISIGLWVSRAWQTDSRAFIITSRWRGSSTFGGLSVLTIYKCWNGWRNLFNISRSGYKIVQTSTNRTFLPNRIANYWNKAPTYVKDAYDVDDFKIRLQEYKEETQFKPQDTGHYWELSDEILQRLPHNDNTKFKTFYTNSNFNSAALPRINV